MPDEIANRDRRKFLVDLAKVPCAALLLGVVGPLETYAAENVEGQEPGGDQYAMGIHVDRCIGCGLCVQACKTENDVPEEPYFFRTWVERYQLGEDGSVAVDSPEGGINGFPSDGGDEDRDVVRSFFVPKLCNQCDNPPCVQVCPVGATFKTEDGIILVDKDYCIGCRYCIQACPYGARYLDPRTKTADKCTFCYHRITKGLLPACVEVCPTQARVFGKLGTRSSPLHRMKRRSSLHVLKPSLNTEPKVLYANLSGEVR